MISGDIQLVINTTDGNQSLRDSFDIRRTALNRQICHYTTLSGAKAGVDSIEALQDNDIEVFCGHGENTTIGFEKTHNPFL